MITRVCSECGREFILTYDLHSYKYKLDKKGSERKYYCSYTCYQKAKLNLESKGKSGHE